MTALWILVPAPFVGYWVLDGIRKAFSEDDELLRTVFAAQPVTALAVATALGSVVVWTVSEVALNLWRAF